MPAPINNRKDLLGFPKSYAFVIGINDYPDINANLSSAVPDAQRMAEVLEQNQGFDHVELLLDASGAELRDLLNRLSDASQEPKIKPKDSLVFYYAGHGKAGEFDEGPAGFILPSDAKPSGAALQNESLIPMELVFDTLKELDCHHTLLILDCCFAGKFRFVGQKSRDTVTPFFMPMFEERFERFKRRKAWQVLVSAGPDQTAADWMGDRIEEGATKHSPFAEALFEALEGKAEIKPPGKNLGDGVLTSQELFLYLWNSIESRTKKHNAQNIQYPGLFPMAHHNGGQFIFFDPNNRINFAERKERNPYLGLMPYQPSDADLYFGHEPEVAEIKKKLKDSQILVITAPSGFGKSSIVRAGLFPLLQKEGYDLIEMRPGSTPLKTWNALDPKPVLGNKQLLFIDQYEELFTICDDMEARASFEDMLMQYLSRMDPLKIVITIRSDFEWQLKDSTFGQTFWIDKLSYEFLYRLPPLSLDQLRRILVSPAWVESYEFESDDLVDAILQEISYAPGALPLLSFTMSELYKITDKDERIFTHEIYLDQLGGVTGALSRVADQIYEQLPSDAHRNMMRKIILRMVSLRDGAYLRRRILFRHQSEQEDARDFFELDFADDHEDKLVNEVLQALMDGQLITRGLDVSSHFYVEPVHNALISFWPRCLKWIKDFGDDQIVLQRQLSVAVQEYLARSTDQRTEALWHNNPKLKQLKTLEESEEHWLNQEELTFIRRSWDRLQEDIEIVKRQRDEAQSAALAAKALLQYPTDNTLALHLSMASYRKAPTSEASDALHEILSNPNSAFITMIAEPMATISEDAPLTAIAIAPMGDVFFTAHNDHQIRLWQPPFDPPAQILQGHENAILVLTCSTDQRWLVSGGEDPFVLLWDLENNESTPVRLEDRSNQSWDTVERAVFSPDGSHLVTAHTDQAIRIWDVNDGTAKKVEDDSNFLLDLAFLSNDRIMGGFDHLMYHTWKLDGSRWSVRRLKKEDDGGDFGDLVIESNIDREAEESCDAMAISADGRTILTCRADGRVVVHDIDNVSQKTDAEYGLLELQGHADVKSVKYSVDGSFILTAAENGSIMVWSAEDYKALFYLDHPHDQISAMCANIDTKHGTYVFTLSTDKTRADIWKLPNEFGLAMKEQSKAITAIAMASDDKWFVAVSDDGTAIIVDMETREVIFSLDHGGEILSTAISGDDKHILTAGRGGKITVWDALSGNQERVIFDDIDAGPVFHVAFTDKDTRIVACLHDEVYLAWDANSGEPLAPTTIGNVLAFGDNEKAEKLDTFLEAGKGTLLLDPFDEEMMVGLMELVEDDGPEERDDMIALAISPDGNQIVTGDWSNRAKVWSASSLEKVFELVGHDGPITAIDFMHERNLIVTVSKDERMMIWDGGNGQLLQTKQVGKARSVTVTSDDAIIIIGGEDGLIQMVPNDFFAYDKGQIVGMSDIDRERYKIDF